MFDPGRPRLPMSLALAGIGAPGGGGFRAGLNAARESGCSAVQMDAAAPDVRPRDLSRSARRDIASSIRREGLVFTGADLWVPVAHYTDPAHADRAMGAVLACVGFVAEVFSLAGPGGGARAGRGGSSQAGGVVGLSLPDDGAVRAHIGEAAHARGVRVADHARPAPDDGSAVGIGLDPGAMLIEDASADPAAEVLRLGGRLACARLTDAREARRVVAGTGDLDVLSYVVALATGGYADAGGYLVADTRGLADPAGAARAAVALAGG